MSVLYLSHTLFLSEQFFIHYNKVKKKQACFKYETGDITHLNTNIGLGHTPLLYQRLCSPPTSVLFPIIKIHEVRDAVQSMYKVGISKKIV